jgi:hypothetical protein
MAVDPELRVVLPLVGTSLAIVVTAIVCGVISLIVVALRMYVRVGERVFGWDDWLMMGGMVSTLPTCDDYGYLLTPNRQYTWLRLSLHA